MLNLIALLLPGLRLIARRNGSAKQRYFALHPFLIGGKEEKEKLYFRNVFSVKNFHHFATQISLNFFSLILR